MSEYSMALLNFGRFVDARMKHYGWSIEKRIGIRLKDSGDEYEGRFVVHLDAFCWVRRDSYLPQGSQGLKAVTKVSVYTICFFLLNSG